VAIKGGESRWRIPERKRKYNFKSLFFDSVEDIQWSAADPTVFATCSADHSIRLWDSRSRTPNDVLRIEGAHDSDVNVITWNRKKAFLLASGGNQIY
jgi:ribosome assembly protein RRB1